jgi:hypothetical protein
MLRIRDQRGFTAGILFLGVGLFAAWVAHGYAFGSTQHMGPGYFPTVLGLGLALIGLLAMLRGLAIEGPPFGRFAWRHAAAVTIGVLAFAALADRFGLIAAVLAVALTTTLGASRARPLEAVAIAVVLALLSAGIFYYGLALPFTLFGRG